MQFAAIVDRSSPPVPLASFLFRTDGDLEGHVIECLHEGRILHFRIIKVDRFTTRVWVVLIPDQSQAA